MVFESLAFKAAINKPHFVRSLCVNSTLFNILHFLFLSFHIAVIQSRPLLSLLHPPSAQAHAHSPARPT